MKPERILLPLDIRECPLEIFSVAESFARRPQVTLILLNVVHLNIIAPENRVYREVALEAGWYLQRLAEQYLRPTALFSVHVRLGKPAEQILEEAAAEKVKLIILPTHAPSFWSRLVSVWQPGVCRMLSPLAEKLVRRATCGVFVANVNTRFNCEEEWGRPMWKNDAAPGYSPAGSQQEAFSLNRLADPRLAL